MPVDLFPPINMPRWWSRRFTPACRRQDIETDITDPLERFFTLASGIDHMESRSLLGVSMIKVYLSAGHQRGCGRDGVVESGAGRFEAPAAGHAAAGGAEVRRVEPAGLPGDGERPGSDRNAASRSRRSSRSATRSRW